jgi:hypothetical protein
LTWVNRNMAKSRPVILCRNQNVALREDIALFI